MADEFRDAIAWGPVATIDPEFDYLWPNTKVADAILAMPEMQAVREALLASFMPQRPGINDATRLDMCRFRMQSAGLPESVIEWVLSPATPPSDAPIVEVTP